jgi:hypothetical protein
VALRLESSRPAEISLALDDGAGGDRLVVAGLDARRGKGRLGPVAVQRDARRGHLTFRVRVPAAAAKGIYSGSIVDDRTGRAVGVLTVRVLA